MSGHGTYAEITRLPVEIVTHDMHQALADHSVKF